jgi:putative transcriptional regulator
MKRRTREVSPTPPSSGSDELHAVEVHLDKLLADRGMTLTELAERAGVTVVNLSVLKNGRARAVRFSTLTAICRVLECQPGDLLTVD